MAKEKKEKEQTEEPKDRMAALLASSVVAGIRKQYGATVIQSVDEQRLKIPRIPTGIFSLDYALGGGFAGGRFNMSHGKKSSGKTTTALKFVASMQKRCATCYNLLKQCECGEFRETTTAWLDTENTFDPKWAQTLGVDTSRLLISQPDFAEQAIDITDALLRSGECDVIVFDSLSFLSPAKELEELTEKAFMGNKGSMMSKAVRKFSSALGSVSNASDGRKPTIFSVSHYYSKVGVIYGSPEVVIGGDMIRNANSIEVKHTSGKPKIDENSEKTISVEMNFKIEKNKTAPPFMEGSFHLYVSDTETKKKGEVGDEDSIMRLSEKTGFLEHRSNKWFVLDREFKKKEDVEKALITEPDFSTLWRTEFMKILLAS